MKTTANDIQKAIIKEIVRFVENEEADVYPGESIIRINFELNFEFHIKNNKLFIKKYTERFKSFDGGFKRIPYLIEVFRIETKKKKTGAEINYIVFDNILLHRTFNLLKEWNIKKHTEEKGLCQVK